MLKKIFKKLMWYKNALLKFLGVKRSYRINNHTIKIDFTHKLPDYQNANPLYDRFLPHLVKYLPEKSVVIDVGANVGDTLAGMAGSNDKLKYLCIEASKDFFSDLKKNTDSLLAQNSNLQISLVNEFVGKDLTDVEMLGHGGTKKAVVGGGDIKSKTMFSIINDLNIKYSNVSLLKSDVDGFDWDVIRSSYKLLEHNPYVFFECQYDNHEQLKSYKNLFSEMVSIGYSKFAFFDNFGQYLLSTESLGTVSQLLNYVKKQNFNNSTRTIYYYDVLAYTDIKTFETESIIDAYDSLLL